MAVGLALLAAAAGLGADIRGAVHVHTRLSHDSRGTFGEIARAAERAGLDFVVLADHPGPGVPRLQPAVRIGRVQFIRGVETQHLLAVNVARPISATTSAGAAREISAQGGLAFAAHPETFAEWDLPGLTGTEIYNLHADVADEFLPFLVPAWAWRLREDPLWAMTAFLDYPGPGVAAWDRTGWRRPFVGIAGNDAHQNVRVLGWQLDPYERHFRFVKTHVAAPAPTVAAVCAALRRGECYSVFSVFGDAEGFSFAASDGVRRARMGGTLVTRRPVRIAVTHLGGAVRLLRDGAVVATFTPGPRDPPRAVFTATSPGAHRVEVVRTIRGRPRVWIVTNPVYVRRPR